MPKFPFPFHVYATAFHGGRLISRHRNAPQRSQQPVAASLHHARAVAPASSTPQKEKHPAKPVGQTRTKSGLSSHTC